MNDPSEAVKEPRQIASSSPSEDSSQVHRSAWKVPSTPVSWVTSLGTAAENIQTPKARPTAMGTAWCQRTPEFVLVVTGRVVIPNVRAPGFSGFPARSAQPPVGNWHSA